MFSIVFAPFFIMYHISATEGSQQLPMDPGLCSKRCNNTSQTTNHTDNGSGLPLFACSCSSSCSLYGDCCYDSEFRVANPPRMAQPTMCLTLSGLGQARAVWKCPLEWNVSSEFCTESTGYLPPVTSASSGITYANIYCAICHDDGENLKIWDVELRCCPELEDSENATHKGFFYRRGHLWMRLSRRRKCVCKYFAHNNATSFLDSLELRTCSGRVETSRCSSSWRGEEEEKLCRSYLDPVYVGDRIYRNIYCALCNFEILSRAECMPAIVQQKLGEGLDMERISQFCERHNLLACMHYYVSNGKGVGYSFTSLMALNERACIPDYGKRCCEGERYDFRYKRCRRLH